jgi:hypothetical protein
MILKILKSFGNFILQKINIKSDKNWSNPIGHVNSYGRMTEDKSELCNIFNNHWTSITSDSNSSIDESVEFIQNQAFNTTAKIDSNFKFSFTTTNEIEDLLASIQTLSGAGICGILTKIFKTSSLKLKKSIVHLFNHSIFTCSIPNEWKTAAVTPLYKKKVKLMIWIIIIGFQSFHRFQNSSKSLFITKF